MQVYLGYWSIPEIESVPRAERERVWRTFLKMHGMVCWRTLAAGAVFGAFLIAGMGLIALVDTGTMSWSWLAVTPTVVLIIFGYFACVQTYIALMRKPFSQFLLKHKEQMSTNKVSDATSETTVPP